jgi:thiol-disulfide isomerase/thioredoxin
MHAVNRSLLLATAVLIGAAAGWHGLRSASGGMLEASLPAAEFTHAAEADWINSAPLRLADLRGRVVLLDFWTFDCWNCYRSIPWLKAVEARFASGGLRVIGVHTPEFDHEKVRDNVAAKVSEFGIGHPVMLDNDFSYWRAMGNRYWPAFYLIDRRGDVRGVFVGETHAGDRQAEAIEAAIAALLTEEVGM